LDITLKRALAAAARAFAEEMERDLPPDPGPAEGIPVPGSSRSMIEVLSSVVRINDEQHRGASDEEMREIAQRAGMDPRGMAGYYAANLLEKRDDGLRWVSGQGRDRLGRLLALSGVVFLEPPAADDAGKPSATARHPATQPENQS
jgi:hypothetical protein